LISPSGGLFLIIWSVFKVSEKIELGKLECVSLGKLEANFCFRLIIFEPSYPIKRIKDKKL